MINPQYPCSNGIPTVYNILIPYPAEVFYCEHISTTLLYFMYLQLTGGQHTHTPSPPKVSSMNTYSTLWYVPFHIFHYFFACYTILIFQIHSTRGFKPILGFKPEILIPWLDTMLENQCKKMTSCSWIKPQWNPSHTIIFLWDFSIL